MKTGMSYQLERKMKWNSGKVKARIASWFNSTTFNPQKLRGILMGMTLTTTLGEICAYKMIRQDIRAGEIPYYTTDVMIVAFAIFEAVLAPFVCWWGYQRRRKMLISYSFIVAICVAMWFFIPGVKERKESELCDAANQQNSLEFVGMSPRSGTRLAVIIYSCIFFVLTRVACWGHGVAYTDEFAPERTSVHYGVVLMARVLTLLLGDRLLTSAVDRNLSMQALGLTLGFIVNFIQLFFIVPKVTPKVDGIQKIALPLEERSFLLSVGRALMNSIVITQMLAMGLMAAALWGFGYHQADIIMVNFNMIRERNTTVHFTEFLSYIYVIVVVAYAGVKFSAPILKEFCNFKAIKQATMMSIFAFIMYVIITMVPHCDKGVIAGHSGSYYGQPECSLSCNCKPHWNEFKPVCVVDNMVTYVSPCQAGCSHSEVLNGVLVYSNCTCSPTGRAILGACNDVKCKQAYRFHGICFFILLTFTLLAFQAQGVLLLRAVDPRDKSVVIGLTWTMVAIIAFVCGHLVFLGIRASNCSWYEANTCHLQSQSFPVLVGATSALLALLSCVVSIGSWICLRMSKKIINTRL